MICQEGEFLCSVKSAVPAIAFERRSPTSMWKVFYSQRGHIACSQPLDVVLGATVLDDWHATRTERMQRNTRAARHP
jgi:hypothetical protein